jgi:NADH:ubiquinone oxidoreductase subunit K
MSIGLEFFLVVSALLFGGGILIVLVGRSGLAMLIGGLLMLLATPLALDAFALLGAGVPHAEQAGIAFGVFVSLIALAYLMVGIPLVLRAGQLRDVDEDLA